MELREKKHALEERLASLGSAAVAFSAGVDSTLLLKVAHEVLGDKAMAVTVRSAFTPERETAQAAAFCAREGIRHSILTVDVLSVPGVAENPPDRCYLCKKALFGRIFEEARSHGMAFVAEGSNMDDLGDYRPGLAAVRELGAVSPLREAGLYKAEIRELSRELGLPTWNKSAFACLASRFAYGEMITADRLAMVDRAEQRLTELGFSQMRVRVHGDLARIEVEPDEFPRLLEGGTAKELDRYFRSLGFSFVTADLGGYRMGNMNRGLESGITERTTEQIRSDQIV